MSGPPQRLKPRFLLRGYTARLEAAPLQGVTSQVQIEATLLQVATSHLETDLLSAIQNKCQLGILPEVLKPWHA